MFREKQTNEKQIYQFKLKFDNWTNLNMKNSIVMLFFFLFRPESKNENFLLKLKFRAYTNLNMENWMVIFCLFVCFFFFFLDWKQHFGLIWFKNSKLPVETGIWSLICIEYVKFDGDVLFFCCRLFPFSILMLTD